MIQKHCTRVGNEQGFVLVLTLVLLILLTLFGVWAMRTSDFELKVAGNAQVVGRQFNITEGAAYIASTQVGFSKTGENARWHWFIPSDLVKDNQFLAMPEEVFDPGKRKYNEKYTSKYKQDDKDTWPDAGDEDTWPLANLEIEYDPKDGTVKTVPDDPSLDYHYLVTYIGSQTASQGYDAGVFTAYTYRMQGSMANPNPNEPHQYMIVETGGKKMGMKLGL